MAWTDLTGDELHTYRSQAVAPPGLDAFWAATLTQTREHDLSATFEPVSTPLRLVQTHDVVVLDSLHQIFGTAAAPVETKDARS